MRGRERRLGRSMNFAISSVPARSLINMSPPTPAVLASSVGLPVLTILQAA
jgi:hypothetical protein